MHINNSDKVDLLAKLIGKYARLQLCVDMDDTDYMVYQYTLSIDWLDSHRYAIRTDIILDTPADCNFDIVQMEVDVMINRFVLDMSTLR